MFTGILSCALWCYVPQLKFCAGYIYWYFVLCVIMLCTTVKILCWLHLLVFCPVRYDVMYHSKKIMLVTFTGILSCALWCYVPQLKFYAGYIYWCFVLCILTLCTTVTAGLIDTWLLPWLVVSFLPSHGHIVVKDFFVPQMWETKARQDK